MSDGDLHLLEEDPDQPLLLESVHLEEQFLQDRGYSSPALGGIQSIIKREPGLDMILLLYKLKRSIIISDYFTYYPSPSRMYIVYPT